MRTTLWVILISLIATCFSFTSPHKHSTRLTRSTADQKSQSFSPFQITRPNNLPMTESSRTTAKASGSDGNNDPIETTKIGFIGCGTIACAIATGIATQSKIPVESIVVSKRSEKKSKQLAENFPDLVRVEEVNQKILDDCDLIFLCVLPELASEVLKNLSFDKERHTLVSLVVSSFDVIWVVS